MKRKGSIQPVLIVGTILVIGVIIFALSKFGILEKDTGKDKKPPVSDLVEEVEEDEKPVVIDPIEEDENDYDIAIGKLAPDFTLTNLQGDEVSLSDYRGKIVLINFWATWCVYCDKEMPDIQALSDNNDDLIVLAVDVMEEKSLVEEYIKDGGYDFEVVLDEDGKIAQEYLVSAFPTSYFVDEEGILLGGVPGMMTGPQMKDILDSIRKGE